MLGEKGENARAAVGYGKHQDGAGSGYEYAHSGVVASRASRFDRQSAQALPGARRDKLWGCPCLSLRLSRMQAHACVCALRSSQLSTAVTAVSPCHPHDGTAYMILVVQCTWMSISNQPSNSLKSGILILFAPDGNLHAMTHLANEGFGAAAQNEHASGYSVLEKP